MIRAPKIRCSLQNKQALCLNSKAAYKGRHYAHFPALFNANF